MTQKKTLVLGASENPNRYSYLAIRKLLSRGHEVVAIGNRKGEVGGVAIQTGQELTEEIDTVTLYLNPTNQKPYYDMLLSLKPRRVIFNPGTENYELDHLLREQGTETMEACTLVMLGSGQY
ncbi:MAG: CoA-binding protein [Sphingobacteriales bacterium]|nr:MAG: CoA-binding protein [Sphingobacteriales bacterium]